MTRPPLTLFSVPVLLTFGVALIILWSTLSPPGPPQDDVLLSDKQLHAIAFALLILPLACTDGGVALRFLPAGLAFGGAIELLQPYVGRTADWLDLLADGVGLCIGLMLGAALRLAWHRVRAR